MKSSNIVNESVFHLRYANESDVELVLYFIKALATYEKLLDTFVATKETLLKSVFIDKKAEVLLAYEGNTPIGFALFYTTFSTFQGKPSLFLEDLFIEEQYRSKGYGKKIFSFLASLALNRNYTRMDWLCLDWNQKSIDFYQSFGAKKLEHWKLFRLQDNKLTELAKYSEIELE